MGLLEGIMQSGEAAKRRIRGLLSDPMGEAKTSLLRAGENAKDLSGLINKNMQSLSQQGYDGMSGQAPSALTQQEGQRMRAGLMNVVGMAPANMIAYHGSPHKFDKFDMSKIGTGEGAQAYGHGLYFAESPEVAKGYAKMGIKDTMGGKVVERQGAFSTNLDEADSRLVSFIGSQGGKDSALKAAQKEAKNSVTIGEKNYYSQLAKDIKSRGDLVGKVDESQLYKVDIPDEAIPRMLDWDKPLSAQSAEVQKVLRNSGLLSDVSGQQKLTNYKDKLFSDFDSGAITREQRNSALSDLVIPSTPETLGQSLYMRLGSQDKATQKLKELGIPGVKYLDGYSRGPQGGSGTRNYVLFDDQLPKILERNGKPLGLLGGQ